MIERLQKRALAFLHDDFEMSYEELLEKTNKVCMKVNRLRNLCVEIYKTIHMA